MAANIDKQQKFIVLRSEGHSYDDIAKKINISKPTLIKWGRVFKDNIKEISEIIEEEFITEQKLRRTLRAQSLSEELDRAYEALKSTDYKNMSKKDLISVIEKMENKLAAIIGTDNELNKPEEYKIIVDSRRIGPSDRPAGKPKELKIQN